MNARIFTLSLVDLALVALLTAAPAGAQEKQDPVQNVTRATVRAQATGQQGTGAPLLPPSGLDAIAKSAAAASTADSGQKGKRSGPADGTGNAYRKGQGNGKGNGQGKGNGNGQGKGKGNGQGKGQYAARDGSGNAGQRPMDGTGHGARSGRGSCDGSGRGGGRGGRR